MHRRPRPCRVPRQGWEPLTSLGKDFKTLATLESSIASPVLKMGYDGDDEHGHDGRYDKNG